MAARRFRSAALWVVAALCFLPRSRAEARMIQRSIQIDGRMDDWQVVLLNPSNLVLDKAYNEGDLDLQIDGTRDLRLGAATWDATNLYLYARRTSKGPGNKKVLLLWYIDVDHDGLLAGTDFVVGASFWPDRIDEARLFGYVPAGASDPIPGDGQDVAGHGLPVTGVVGASVNNANDVEYEVSVPWSALGLPPGTPVHLRPAIHQAVSGSASKLDDAVLSLPAGIFDNGVALDTAFHDFTLSPGTIRGADPGALVAFPHEIRVQGNVPETINLRATSADALAIELWSDPDGDGDPADGALLSLDANGDGDFVDPGDVLAPGADSDGDLRPDSGVLAPGTTMALVFKLQLPMPLNQSGDYPIHVDASDSVDRALTASAIDVARSGRVSVFAPGSRSAGPGVLLEIRHTVCNHSNSDETDLSAVSVLGWPVAILVGGVPVTSVLLGNGQCVEVVLQVSVPAVAAPGTLDSLTFRATLRSGSKTDSLQDLIRVSEPLTVTPDHSGFAVAGTSLFYSHRIINSSAASCSFRLSATSTLGSSVSFWTDPDGDGNPADGQPVSLTPAIAAFGGELPIVAQVDISPFATQDDVDRMELSLAGVEDPTLSARAVDQTTVRIVGTYAADYPAPAATAFPGCATVFAAAGGLPDAIYRYRWLDALGNLIRMSAPKSRDGLGLVRDNLVLFSSDPLGTWRLLLETQQGSSWVPVDPGGEIEFGVLGDLRPDGGVFWELYPDLLNYPQSGVPMNLTATIADSSPFFFDRSRIDYVVFRDANGDAVPSAGETFLQPDGSTSLWSSGRNTCRASDLPRILPGARLTETGCQGLGPMSFPATGGWALAAEWRTECGYLIASRTTLFNVGCGVTSVPDAGTDRLICQGASVQIGLPVPAPGYTFAWSPVDYLDDPTSQTPWATPFASMTYVASAIEAGTGCVGQDQVVVLVNSPPPANAGPSVQICAGSSVRIGTPGVPGRAYSWSPALGLDDPLAAEPLATPAATTSYSLTVTDTVTSCSGNAATVVTVAPLPVADAGPDRTGAGPIGPATCDPGVTYSWSPATGLDDATACNPIASPALSQTYCLTVRDLAVGCASAAPDCTLVTVTPCATAPPSVNVLRSVRAGVDLAFDWIAEPLAVGGYHLYRTASRNDLALPPSTGTLVASTTASSGATSAIDAGAVSATAGSPLYYRVVAVCGDGTTEGP